MSQLLKLVKEYQDANGGVSQASIARSAGIESRTFNSWFKRGLAGPPPADELRRLAPAIGCKYKVVLDAVLHDFGYLPEEGQAYGKSPAEKSPPPTSIGTARSKRAVPGAMKKAARKSTTKPPQ